MKLIDALNNKLDIESLLEEKNGEISEEEIKSLAQTNSEIVEHSDRFVYALQKRVKDLQYIKEIARGRIASLNKQVESMKKLAFHVVKIHGEIDTPFCYIRPRKTASKVTTVTNFEYVQRTYPDAVTVETKDNVKTIKISKEYLKNVYDKENGDVEGFDVTTNVNESVSIKVKGYTAGTKS